MSVCCGSAQRAAAGLVAALGAHLAPPGLVLRAGGGGPDAPASCASWHRSPSTSLHGDCQADGRRATALCSLLIAEGLSVVEVAPQAGHAPTMTLDTYAHVMADVDGSDRVSAEAAIRAAREAEVPESVRLVVPRQRRLPNTPVFWESPPSDSNREPLHYK